jgi:phosphoglycerate dehydrogenase-like enzyme
VTTIAIWSNWPSTPTDFSAALANETLVLINDESDLARAAAAEVAFCGISLDRVRKLLAATPKLRWFHTPAAGVDRLLDLPEFRERGIVLTNNSGSYDIQIAIVVTGTPRARRASASRRASCAGAATCSPAAMRDR